MSDLQIMIGELIEEICDEHCIHNKDVDEDGCTYCKEHDGECYLDRLIKAVGLDG